MNFVYFLKSVGNNWVYVGSTTNLKRRFCQHNRSLVKSTKHKAPFKLIYFEAYQALQSARKRERQIKASWSVEKEILNRL